jgi:nucleoside-diphosphate-sugar epimerase
MKKNYLITGDAGFIGSNNVYRLLKRGFVCLYKDQSTSLAVALTARLYNYLNSGVIGSIGLMREGQTLSGVYTQLKKP